MDAARTHRWRRAAVIALGVVAGAVVLVWVLRRPGEPLTEDALRAARDRWAAHGPRTYDLQVMVGGIQQGAHAVRVRDGKVVAMTTGGAEVPESAWSYWTVEGMFGFLAEELDHVRRPQASYGVEDPAHVVLHVHFDADLGHPRTFVRHVMGRSLDIHWEASLAPAER